MGIRIEYGRPETLLTAAQMVGEERAAQQQLEVSERRQAQQREFEYRTAIRQQDMAIDLQMQERAKLWEIDKMELRSRLDFEREEKKRQRVLDEYDAAIKYINDSDLFDEQQKEGLIFKAGMKLLNQNITGADKIIFPTEPTQRQVTPTQRVSAMKKLREEEAFQEPTRWQKFVPEILGGRPSELSPEILAEKELLESIAAGQYEPPAGTISPDLPKPTTQAEYDSIPRGSQYMDSKGNVRTKS